MHTRRQFITAAGTFAAATVFAPQALAQGLTTSRRAPVLRSGKFTDGLISGDPTPHGITLWTRVAGIDAPGRVELEVARDKSFRHVVARQEIGTNKALNHSVKARVGHLQATRAVLLPLLHRAHALRDRALPDRAAGGLEAAGQLRLLVLPGLHARLLQRL